MADNRLTPILQNLRTWLKDIGREVLVNFLADRLLQIILTLLVLLGSGLLVRAASMLRTEVSVRGTWGTVLIAILLCAAVVLAVVLLRRRWRRGYPKSIRGSNGLVWRLVRDGEVIGPLCPECERQLEPCKDFDQQMEQLLSPAQEDITFPAILQCPECKVKHSMEKIPDVVRVRLEAQNPNRDSSR